MTKNTSKNTIAQDSMSGISRTPVFRVQNSTGNISVCAPNTRITSVISPCVPTSGSNKKNSSYEPTGSISSCAPKNNK